MDCKTQGFPVFLYLPELAQTHVHWVSDALPPASPPAFYLSQIRVFSNESALPIRWPKYWSFSFSISPSIEYSGLISFKIEWFDLLAVQGILKSLVQHHSLKISILQCSAFFMVQLSYSYMITGKTIALTRQTFVCKVMSLLFNMLSGFVITFLPRRRCLLISWLQSPSTMILEPKKIKSHSFHSHLPPLFVLWMLSFKPTFLLFSFTLIKRLFSSSLFSAIMVVSSPYLRLLIFLTLLLECSICHMLINNSVIYYCPCH